MLHRSLLFVTLLAIGLHLNAQDRCTAHTLTQRYLLEQGLPTDIGKALGKLPSGQPKGGGPLTIPVVVHVVWNITAENVPDAVIQGMIATMNDDFLGTNSDLTNVRPAFTGVQNAPNIAFCLAQVDPNGNPTTGITRTQTSDTWFDPDTETNDMKAPPTGRSPWAPDSYLNIWICDISSGLGGGLITTGYAYLPVGGMVGSNIDGIVIDYNYGLDPGARTATHETGHYLGLQHPWGTNGGCVDDDGFTDTPDTDGPTFSCSPTNQTSCGVLTQYENFMDYSSCSCMYTDQQSAEMAGILTGVRADLLNSAGCGTTPSGPCVPDALIGTGDGDFIDGVVLGSIVNTSTGSTTGPSYTDYSSTESTQLAIGGTYTIAITSGNYSPDHYAAWIDLDQDDLFEPAEKLGEFTTTGTYETQTLAFTVPLSTPTGTTVLRVRGVYHNTGEPSPTAPCFEYTWGETEDYGIDLVTTPNGPCIPTSANGTTDGDFIDGVVLGTIMNTATGSTTGPSYTDYTTETTDLVRGQQYDIIITAGDYVPDHYAAWIDLDQDDVFEASEKLGEFTNTSVFQSVTLTFTVPNNAVLGTTRLRVRGVYHANGEPDPTDPCFAYAWGETEDYSVNIGISTGLANTAGSGLSIAQVEGGILVTLPLGAPATGPWQVFDGSGRMVLQGAYFGTRIMLNMVALAPGMHQFVVATGDRRLSTRFPVLR